MDGFFFVQPGTFRQFVTRPVILSSIMGFFTTVLRWLPSGGMILGGFVMATFDKFVIIQRVKSLPGSTQLVERERGEAVEIEKKMQKFNATVGHPSLKFEVTPFFRGCRGCYFAIISCP
jgi:hypothetical protein